YADVREYALVCNQLDAKVSVIDIRRGRVIRTLDLTDLGLDPQAAPHDVESEPDGSAWYVALINENSVVKFSTDLDAIGQGSPALLDQTPGPANAFTKPGMLTLGMEGTATEGLLFAGRSFSDMTGSDSFAIIERATMEYEEEGVVPYTRPHAIAQVGDFVLSASLSENTVASIDIVDSTAPTPTLADVLTLGSGPDEFVMFDVRPDGQEAVLTSAQSGEVFLLDVSDPTNLGIDAIVPVGAGPWHPTYSPDSGTLYVPNRDANSISVIDVATQTVETITDPALAQPHGSAITADGRFLVVSSRNTMGGYTPEFPFPKSTSAAPETDAEGRVMASSTDLCGVSAAEAARSSVAGSPGTVVIVDTQTNAVVHVIEIGRFASGVEVVNR
ncbi:MAG: beta-propeller fold lactonase family protein, partial [Bacteroidota bacterium]